MAKSSNSNLRSASFMRNRFKQVGRPLRPSHLIIVLIASAIMVWVVWWFYHNFEQVTTTDYTLQTEAQYNPYYAAELLINSPYNSDIVINNSADTNKNDAYHNAPATTLLDSDLKTLLDALPEIDRDDSNQGTRPTLIINSIGTKLTDERFDVLKSWIEQGGHLITFTSRTSDSKDLQAALERLSYLNDEQASAETIARDERLNSLLEPLNSGNEFLNQLGIFQVNSNNQSDSTNSIAEDGEAPLDKLLNETQEQQDLELNKSSTAFNTEIIAELADVQPLSFINLTAPHNNASNASDVIDNNLLLVKTNHFDDQLDARLFQAFYPDNAHIERQQLTANNEADKKTITQQAQLIRRYINSQINQGKQQVWSSPSNNANDKSSPIKVDNSENRDLTTRLPGLLTAILELNDAQLVALFYPANHIYLEARFGNGRLSVINDNNVFSNPNPNIELSANANNVQIDATPNSVLHELLTPDSYYTSLLSADNAAWLLALIQDSSTVWILPNTDVDSLPVMLWKQARPALLGLGLLAFLWLWSLYNRFGKMTQLPTNQSRDIMRYFRQVGRFGWHQDRAQQLTQATKDRVRLLMHEHLNNAVNSSSLTDVHINNNEQLPITTLHELLSTRLGDKKRLLLRSISMNEQDNNTSHVNTSYTSNGSKSNDNKDSNERLLLTNEDFIRATISHDRLQSAFDSQLQDNIQAFEFTQITQTLWMVQWLLK